MSCPLPGTAPREPGLGALSAGGAAELGYDLMAKAVLAADASPLLVACSLYPVPVLFTEQLKLATPFDAVAGLDVQLSLTPDGPPVSESLTEALDEVATTPDDSSTETFSLNLDPTTDLDGGSVVKASLVAAVLDPIPKAELVAEDSPLLAATSL